MKYTIDLSRISEKEKGYVVGFYVGDGNIFVSKTNGIYRLRYFLWYKEIQTQRKLQKILRKLTLAPRLYRDKDNMVVIELHSKEFVSYILSVCNKNGLKKQNSNDFLRGFIEGLIDSDGHVQRNYTEITTSSSKLKNNIVEVLNKIGISSNIRNYHSSILNKEGWRVGFSLNGLKLKPEKWVPTP